MQLTSRWKCGIYQQTDLAMCLMSVEDASSNSEAEGTGSKSEQAGRNTLKGKLRTTKFHVYFPTFNYCPPAEFRVHLYPTAVNP